MTETAWIRMLGSDEADGPLAELYAQIADPTTGRMDHILQVHGLSPEGLAAHLALYKAAMRGTPTLRKVDRELLAFVVSTINGCHY